MSRRRMRWIARAAALGAISGTGVAQGAIYSWTGLSTSNDNWDTCANWIVNQIGVPCYPSADTDDVLVSGTFDVDLITESIRNLTVSGTVGFGSVSGTPTLEINAITISGGSSGATVTISSGTIKTR